MGFRREWGKFHLFLFPLPRLTFLHLGMRAPDGVWLRKSLYSRPLRGLVSRRALAFPRDNRGGFNLGSAANTSVCAAG